MEMQKINDSLDSLHKRMDSFYIWASQLQVEHRDLKQRLGFMESAMQFAFKEEEENEEELLKRLRAVK